ncbi:MAG: sugar ABC transporter ATP-binding protein [Clostridiales Family XIII bacterium]|jgi:ABC-type sugar transport system ATPase subunit|nr:sugar ABC transporter ATP-binding protein [Clostridiales Family XIII bacterium]
MSDYIMEATDIVKDYPGVRALKSVALCIKKGTVHCIVGENGAGKSTFIKILTGAETMTSGTILLDGKPYEPKDVRDAMRHGISVLYQELNTVEGLTVEENLMLGKEATSFGVMRKSDESKKALMILGEIAPDINPAMKTKIYSVAQRQMIEIARAIAEDAKILILDEPTASLSDEEIRSLFRLLDELKKKQVTIIYISHRLDEIFTIGDEVTVFRDGQIIDTKPVSQVDGQQELIRMMLGKVVVQTYIPSKADYNTVVLSARGLTNRVLKNVDFDLYKGEILGFYGLVGAGKSEVARAIYGVDSFEGEVSIRGQAVKIHNPWDAIAHGVVLAPEERRAEAIFPVLPISDNVVMMNMRKILQGLVTNRAKQRSIAESYREKLSIATDSIDKKVAQLSGGNQQKVVASKCLNADPEILMMDEPTRGIDVGAKEEIHNIIRQLANEGQSVIVFSSELSEIVNLCDRIVLMNDGEAKAIVKNWDGLNPDDLMAKMAND